MKTILLFIGFLTIRAVGIKVGLELIPADMIKEVIGEMDIATVINSTVTGYVTGSALHRNPHRAGKAVLEKQIPYAMANIKNLFGK